MTVPAILDPPGSIFYHYTTLAKALELIVPAQRLRLNPFSSMRDPRESSDWSITGGGYGEHDVDDLRNWGEFTRAVNELKGYVKVLSLTRDDPAATAAEIAKLDDGGHVEHDIEHDFGNWDHVIVGPAGVFLLDSKRRSTAEPRSGLQPPRKTLSTETGLPQTEVLWRGVLGVTVRFCGRFLRLVLSRVGS